MYAVDLRSENLAGVPGDVLDLGNGSYVGRYFVTISGTYRLHVTLLTGDAPLVFEEEVAQSPSILSVESGGQTSADLTRVHGLGVGSLPGIHGTAGEPSGFLIQVLYI